MTMNYYKLPPDAVNASVCFTQEATNQARAQTLSSVRKVAKLLPPRPRPRIDSPAQSCSQAGSFKPSLLHAPPPCRLLLRLLRQNHRVWLHLLNPGRRQRRRRRWPVKGFFRPRRRRLRPRQKGRGLQIHQGTNTSGRALSMRRAVAGPWRERHWQTATTTTTTRTDSPFAQQRDGEGTFV